MGVVVVEAQDCRSDGGEGLDEYEEDEGLTKGGGESGAARRRLGSKTKDPIGIEHRLYRRLKVKEFALGFQR